MSYSNLPSAIGVLIGSALLPNVLQKFSSLETIEKRLAPYRQEKVSEKLMSRSTLPLSVMVLSFIAGLVLLPTILFYKYHEIQGFLFANPGLLFPNNGQYLIFIIGLLFGPFLFAFLYSLGVHPFASWRNRISAKQIEGMLIAAKKLKLKKDLADENQQLLEITRHYDLKKINRDSILRYLWLSLILFVVLLPVAGLGFKSYVRVGSEGISVAPVLGFSEKFRAWEEVNLVDLYIDDESSEGRVIPHFDFVFEDGARVNIWDTSIPRQSTEDLLDALDLAKSKSLPVQHATLSQDLSSLQEGFQLQIRVVMGEASDGL